MNAGQAGQREHHHPQRCQECRETPATGVQETGQHFWTLQHLKYSKYSGLCILYLFTKRTEPSGENYTVYSVAKPLPFWSAPAPGVKVTLIILFPRRS